MRKISLRIMSSLLFFSMSSLSFSLPAPKYLSVPKWQSCVNTITKGSAQYVCLPAKKPTDCPVESWRMLTEGKLIERCY